MPDQKNLRYFPDGTTVELTPAELAEVRAQAEAIVEAQDFSRLVMRSCWLCNAAHLHLAADDSPEESYLLRCFGCGRFFLNGKDLTNYSGSDEASAEANG